MFTILLSLLFIICIKMRWYSLHIYKSFMSIYHSFHYFFNCRQLFRTSGPHQYSALNKKFFEKLTNCRCDYLSKNCNLVTPFFLVPFGWHALKFTFWNYFNIIIYQRKDNNTYLKKILINNHYTIQTKASVLKYVCYQYNASYKILKHCLNRKTQFLFYLISNFFCRVTK